MAEELGFSDVENGSGDYLILSDTAVTSCDYCSALVLDKALHRTCCWPDRSKTDRDVTNAG